MDKPYSYVRWGANIDLIYYIPGLEKIKPIVGVKAGEYIIYTTLDQYESDEDKNKYNYFYLDGTGTINIFSEEGISRIKLCSFLRFMNAEEQQQFKTNFKKIAEKLKIYII